MKKIEYKDVGVTQYYEKLDNGLTLYMIPKPNVNNVYVTYTAKYGSIHNEFVPLGEKKLVKVPTGIAHFLEHKMFEQRDGIDPLVYFTEKGADVNAFTSYKNTTYLFCGALNVKENLEYLLNLLNSPYFTDENIEKEKGIIEQEIKMYDDMPSWVLIETIYNNIFHKHPLKYPVAGTVASVNKITKEQLYQSYHTFYQPHNMFLVVTGNFEPNEIRATVKAFFSNQKQRPAKEIKLVSIKEPDSVVKETEIKKLDVEIPRLGIGLKIPKAGITLDPYKLNFYITTFLNLMLRGTSHFYEEMVELGYLGKPPYISNEITEEHIIVSILMETKKPDLVLTKIKQVLKKPAITVAEFKRKQNLLIPFNITAFENIKFLNRNIINHVISYGDFNYNMIKSKQKSLNFKEFNELIKKLDFTKMVTVIIEPEKLEKVGVNNVKS